MHNNNEKPHLLLRNILNIIFIILAVTGVIWYFYADEFVGTIIILAGMAFKFCESIIRMLRF